MEKFQEGVVVSNEGEFSRVNVQAHSSCDSCGACDSSKMVILAFNPLKALPGQRVRFVMPDGNMMKIALVLFVLPLLSLFAGAYVGYLVSVTAQMRAYQTLFMIAAAGALFVLSVLNIIRYDRKYKMKTGNFAEIVEIIK